MKVISIPTLTLTRLSGASGNVTATIQCGIGYYDTGNMNASVGDYWPVVDTGVGGQFNLAQVDQDNTQTNLVSVGDTKQVVCDPDSLIRTYPVGSGRGHQGFKTKCTFSPFTEVTGDFVIQITRLS